MRTRPRHRGCWFMALGAACVALLIGCAGQQQQANGPGPYDPSLIRSPIPKPEATGPLVVLSVHRVSIPLEASTAEAWGLVNEDILPPISRAVWHNNGLRIGMIEGYKIDQLAEAIPPTRGMQRSQVIVDEHPLPILKADTIGTPIVVDLTIPPRAVREVRASQGRMQLVAEMTPYDAAAGGHGLTIRLIPHQHVPKVSLTPRDPLEKEMDGRLFTELALQLDLPPDKMLVLGLMREPQPPEVPEPPEVPPVPAAPGAAPASRPAPGSSPGSSPRSSPEPQVSAAPADAGAGSGAAEAPPPPAAAELLRAIPPHLGRALLTADRLGRPVQHLVLLSVQTLDPAEMQTRR